MDQDTSHDFADLTIAGYNLVQGVLTVLHELVSSDNDDVCLRSAATLARLGHPSSQTAIFRALELRVELLDRLLEPASRFRTPAMLQRLSDLLWTDLTPALKSRLLTTLGAFEDPDVLSIFDEFSRHEAAEIREGVARGVAGQRGAAAEASALAVRLLDDESRDVVTQAVVALRAVGNEGCVEAIERTLRDYRDPYVRSAALLTLGQLSMGASRELIKKYLKDNDARIRASAVEALGRHLSAAPETIRDLMSYLDDENNRVRANAVIALYPYARDEALTSLHGLVTSPRKWYRASAAYCVGELQYPEIMAKLVPLMNTEQEPEVMARALDAISKITKVRLKGELFKLAAHPKNELRERAIETLTRVAAPDDLPHFLELLRREAVPSVTAALLRAVGRFVDAGTYTPLLDVLGDRNPVIVEAALDGLRQAQQASAIPLVTPLASHAVPSVRAFAAASLVVLGQTSALGELEGLLRQGDTSWVTAAVDAAGELFVWLHELRERRPPVFIAALREHFTALQASDVEQLRSSLAAAAAAPATDGPREASTPGEVQRCKVLRETAPLQHGTVPEALSAYVRQNPSDYLVAFLERSLQDAGPPLAEELVQEFRTEHFLPGLFLALDQIKAGGDVRRLISHYLEMATVEIRILLEFINRAMRYVQDRNDNKALKMLDFLFHYLRLSPDIHDRFGSFYLVQKDYDLAYSHLFKAFTRAPGNLDLLLKLAGAATRLNKLAVGELLATTVLAQAGGDAALRGRAEGMLGILAELRRGSNPDRRSRRPAEPAPPATPARPAPPPEMHDADLESTLTDIPATAFMGLTTGDPLSASTEGPGLDEAAPGEVPPLEPEDDDDIVIE